MEKNIRIEEAISNDAEILAELSKKAIRNEFGRINSFRNKLQLNIGYGHLIKLL